MHVDVGTLVWVGIVIFGVISSMIKNARSAGIPKPAPRASVPQQVLASVHGSAPPASAPAPAPPPEIPQPPVVVKAAAAPAIVRRAPVPPAPTIVPLLAPKLDVHGTEPLRGMFGRRADLVRAIVAAQVLGPPKALQEHSIWSPRHDEASI